MWLWLDILCTRVEIFCRFQVLCCVIELFFFICYNYRPFLLPAFFSKIFCLSSDIIYEGCKIGSSLLKTDNIRIFFHFLYTRIKLWRASRSNYYLYCLRVACVLKRETVGMCKGISASLACLWLSACAAYRDHTEMMRKELEWNLVSAEINWASISLSPDSIHNIKQGISLSRQSAEMFLSFCICFHVSS